MSIKVGQRYRVTPLGRINGFIEKYRTILSVSEYLIRYQIVGYGNPTSDEPTMIQGAIDEGYWVLDNHYPQSLQLPQGA